MSFLTFAQKNAMLLYGYLSVFYYFCGWIEDNSIQDILRKKKCYAYLVIGNLGNSQLYTRMA